MKKKFLGLAAFLGLIACSQEAPKGSIQNLERLYTDFIDLNDELEQQRSDLYTLIREYNLTHDESEQFDIAKFDTLMGEPERDLLRAMFREEKDISYNGLLSNIIARNNEIIALNGRIEDLSEEIASLEAKLPKAYLVQRGDTHYQIVRDFLIAEHELDLNQARKIAWRTSMTDNLLPGYKIWLSFDKDQEIIGTYVTKGDAKISPMRYEQIAKNNMIQKAVEKAMRQGSASNNQVSVSTVSESSSL